MSQLEILTGPPRRRLPPWLKRGLPFGPELLATDRVLSNLGLETVCREALCPNRVECWSRQTATFMILGRVCTRACGFCAVERGVGEPPADDEPERLAIAAAQLGLRHVVITSVTRDDLPDGGAEHFRRCILAVRDRTGASVEVLTPDFDGDLRAVDVVLSARPDVFNHNLETVARLQQKVRRRAGYRTSLEVLAYARAQSPGLATKSGIMLGLGETTAEVVDTLSDLRNTGCELLTMGQYLQPSPRHLAVERYVSPDEFADLGRLARRLGFRHVASAPLVRSSYHADEALLTGAADRTQFAEASSDDRLNRSGAGA